MFRNAHDQQIPKLSLGVQFDQEFMQKTSETSCCKLKRVDCMLAIQYFSEDLEEVKQKYKTLKQLHEKFEVEIITFGALQSKNWYYRQLVPIILMDHVKTCSEKLKSNKLPELRRPLKAKLKKLEGYLQSLVVDQDASLLIVEQQAIGILDEVGPTMKRFALGTDRYSIGDVLMTCFLKRLTLHEAFFDQEVREKRPDMFKYLQRMSERQSAMQLYYPM